jgi:hypothetical protein
MEQIMSENLFEALTEQEKGVLITAAVQFKSVIIELFGEDYGDNAFNNIADSVLPSLKYEMLKNALTNKYNLTVTIAGINKSHPSSGRTGAWGYEKVSSIKAIRTYAKGRLGLKESKDICDAAENGIKTVLEVSSIGERNEFIRELTSFGLTVY